MLKRGDKAPEGSGPIIVATRNDALAGIAEATPADRRADLVFIQNGMLQPWLDSQGLGDNTQVNARVTAHMHDLKADHTMHLQGRALWNVVP